jgi:hypothetical protein
MQTAQQAKSLKTATYLLRFTPEEKAQLEQKCRIVSAELGRPVTLADALRAGAARYVDELLGDEGVRVA